MLKVEDIVLALKDAGITGFTNPALLHKVAEDLEGFANASGVITGQDLLTLLNSKDEAYPPYIFYVCPADEQSKQMRIFSIDYPKDTVVIDNDRSELMRVGQEIIYEAHSEMMAHGALIRPPMREINEDVMPKEGGIVRVVLGDLYALRLFQYNLKVCCERLNLEPSLDLDPDDSVYLH